MTDEPPDVEFSTVAHEINAATGVFVSHNATADRRLRADLETLAKIRYPLCILHTEARVTRKLIGVRRRALR